MKEEIKDKILSYLNEGFHKKHPSFLRVLDNKYRSAYTGVTLNYITYDLLKAKYRKSDVAKSLKELFFNKQINSLFCPHIKKVVFENKKTRNYGFFNDFGFHNMTYFNDYINKFIKNE